MTQKSFRCFIRVTVRNLIIRIRKCLSITLIIRDNYLYQHMTMTPDAYEKYFLYPPIFQLLLNFPRDGTAQRIREKIIPLRSLHDRIYLLSCYTYFTCIRKSSAFCYRFATLPDKISFRVSKMSKYFRMSRRICVT